MLLEGILVGLITGGAFLGTLLAHGAVSLFSSSEKNELKNEKVNGQIYTKISVEKVNSSHGVSLIECIAVALTVMIIIALIGYCLARWCYNLHKTRENSVRNNVEQQQQQYGHLQL